MFGFPPVTQDRVRLIWAMVHWFEEQAAAGATCLADIDDNERAVLFGDLTGREVREVMIILRVRNGSLPTLVESADAEGPQ